MARSRKIFKSPVFLGLGVFGLTMLGILVAFGLQFGRAAASQTAPPELPGTYQDAPAEPVVPVDFQSSMIEAVETPSSYFVLLESLGLTPEDVEALPRPVIDGFLPAGLGTVGFDDLLPLAAVPNYDLTPAFTAPDGEAVLALDMFTDAVIEYLEGRWTVVGLEDGWVRVIVPVGRGALPSEDPAAVNHQAVWVPAEAVTLEDELNRIEVNISDRLLTVFYNDEVVGSFHVGVGVIGRTDTPLGLCSIIGAGLIQTGAESLLTSCQSEMLDVYAGSSWATIALHEGEGFSQATGGAISNGCVRVSVENFAAYLEDIPVGTPVLFTP